MVLTDETHIVMWQVSMGRSQGEAGRKRLPEPSRLGSRAEGDRGNVSVVLSVGQDCSKTRHWKGFDYKGD